MSTEEDDRKTDRLRRELHVARETSIKAMTRLALINWRARDGVTQPDRQTALDEANAAVDHKQQVESELESVLKAAGKVGRMARLKRLKK
jgi:hypothetical protein